MIDFCVVDGTFYDYFKIVSNNIIQTTVFIP